MHRMRIYVDTSVFGGVFDEQFAVNGYAQIPIHSPLEMAYDDEN
ncbi:MAG: hypothetical protein ABSA26_11950 [Thermoguttaceae bacterium]|jgi:hypothetical protein